MSVESQLTKVVYSGNGATTVFPVPFPYSRPEHLKVMITRENDDREDTSNFKLELFENGDTNVIYPLSGDPLASAERLTIYRQTPRTQILDLIYGGAFSPETLESDGFDRLCMMVQELGEESQRSLRLPIDSTEGADLGAVFTELSGYQAACAEIADQVKTDLESVESLRDNTKEYAENAQSAASELNAAVENVASSLETQTEKVTGLLATQTETVTGAMSSQSESVNAAMSEHTEEMNGLLAQARQYAESLGDATSWPRISIIDSNTPDPVLLGNSGFVMFTGNGSPQLDLDISLPEGGLWIIYPGQSRVRLVQKQISTGSYISVGGSSSTLIPNNIYSLNHVSNWQFVLNIVSGTAYMVSQPV